MLSKGTGCLYSLYRGHVFPLCTKLWSLARVPATQKTSCRSAIRQHAVTLQPHFAIKSHSDRYHMFIHSQHKLCVLLPGCSHTVKPAVSQHVLVTAAQIIR